MTKISKEDLLNAFFTTNGFLFTDVGKFIISDDVILTGDFQRDHETRVKSGKVNHLGNCFYPGSHDVATVAYYTGETKDNYVNGNFYLLDGNTRRYFYKTYFDEALNASKEGHEAKFPKIVSFINNKFIIRVIEFKTIHEMINTYDVMDNPNANKNNKDSMYSASKGTEISDLTLFTELTSVLNKVSGTESMIKKFAAHASSFRKAQIELVGGYTVVNEALEFIKKCAPKAKSKVAQRLFAYFMYTNELPNKADLRNKMIQCFETLNSRGRSDITDSSGMTPSDYMKTVIKESNEIKLTSKCGGDTSLVFAHVMLNAAKIWVEKGDEPVYNWGKLNFSAPYADISKMVKDYFNSHVKTAINEADVKKIIAA